METNIHVFLTSHTIIRQQRLLELLYILNSRVYITHININIAHPVHTYHKMPLTCKYMEHVFSQSNTFKHNVSNFVTTNTSATILS
jgi:hypothetical protein